MTKLLCCLGSMILSGLSASDFTKMVNGETTSLIKSRPI